MPLNSNGLTQTSKYWNQEPKDALLTKMLTFGIRDAQIKLVSWPENVQDNPYTNNAPINSSNLYFIKKGHKNWQKYSILPKKLQKLANSKACSGTANKLARSLKSRVSKQVLIVCIRFFITQYWEISHSVIYSTTCTHFLLKLEAR